jgi:hypothetical protein
LANGLGISTIPDADDGYHKLGVVNVVNHSIVTNPDPVTEIRSDALPASRWNFAEATADG